MQKVIVIGIDGATPDLIEPWMNDGKLPNFDKIRKRGTWGKLASTIPPFSAPAWTSIITGCNPGKHGIYGFESTGTLEPHLINSHHRKVPAIWSFLTKIGMKSIVVNVPGTYPPEKINGAMITGLLTPSRDSNFTYPKQLKEQLTKDDLGEYELEQFWLEDFSRSRMKKRAPNKLADHINKQMASRSKVGLNLMSDSTWDFAMIVFRGTDTAQHFFFDRKDLLLSCYQKVDELIGEIVNKFPDALFFIVSDHGFEEIKKVLYPDNVLYNAGFLTPTQDPHRNLTFLSYSLVFRIINCLLRILPPKVLKESKVVKKFLFSISSKAKLIDFSKTKAFSTADGRGIQICRKDKYENGIVDLKDYEQLCKEISTLFKDLKDPKDSKYIIENVHQWNEIYNKDAKDPPDLIFSMKKGNTALEWIRFPKSMKDILLSKERCIPYIFNEDPIGRSGDHATHGIFFAYGKEIKSNYKIDKISVEDVLPMVFTGLELPLPDSIDGKIHENVFVKKPSMKRVDWNSYSSNKQILSKGEEDKIKEIRNMFKPQ